MLKTEVGAKAENLAVSFLQHKGLKILIQNYKALPHGEIDIIALDKEALVFIEVKYRKSKSFGSAEEMVNATKQQKIINTAQIFFQQNEQYLSYDCRFDVVAINNKDLNWIKSAFQI
ncbi:YraN family protein [Pseudofrancisella aestuarii]|uniref:UPF0102 protein ACFPDQ_05590 n=1 Tax=Pseudofrancisella aestuarii TaxID=2670347 RepID=A0ABV9TC48_9GAMM|nr:YraN family protein [Pseudofrancisella aestuarii]